MSIPKQTVICPSCSSRVLHDQQRAGRSIICIDCKVVYTGPGQLEVSLLTTGEDGARVRLSSDGTWSHVGLPGTGNIEIQRLATAPTQADPIEEAPAPLEEMKLGMHVTAMHTTIGEKPATVPAPVAAQPPPQESAKEITEEAPLSAFADLPWCESEERTRATLEERGYALEGREERANGPALKFGGNMGTQPVDITCSFTGKDELDQLFVEVYAAPQVQRDLYQAMVQSLDAKYGTEKHEDHEGGTWSAAWLVQSFTTVEWTIAVTERLEGGKHAVCGHYNSPRYHAQTSGVVA
jgi:hypothetical protein